MNNMSPTNNIRFVNGVFELETQNTSYLFRVTPFKHLEHLYYGIKVEINDADALSLKRNCGYGDSVYRSDRIARCYNISIICLFARVGGIGKRNGRERIY